MHLDPCAPYTKVIYSHFQQFLHWGIPEFILVPQIMEMCLPILKQWLIRVLPDILLQKSQMSIHIIAMSQTSFSLYLHNQWTNFHKLSCTVKPQMRAICTYVGCTKATTNNQDIRSSVTVKSLFANISWMTEQICMIKLALKSAHQTVSNYIWYII